MEKKDWKKKLRELSFMKGYYFKLEDNGLVEKKDDQLVFNREELEHFVQQELDKAREEQFTQKELKRIEELLGFMLSDYPSSFWKPEDKSIEKKLSKLKDNK